MAVTYAIIFLLAAIPFFEVAAIIPIAIIGGVPAIPTMIVAFLGNLLTIVLLIIFVDKIIARRKKRKKNKEEDDSKSINVHAIFGGKYGLPGLAFIDCSLLAATYQLCLLYHLAEQGIRHSL